jgi:uncharacterized protein
MTPQTEHPMTSTDHSATDPTTTDPANTETLPQTADSAHQPDAGTETWHGPTDWQRLPARARRVFLYVALLVAIPPTLVASLTLYENLPHRTWAWPAIGGLWVAAIGFAFWVAHKRYYHTYWKLDADGFAVRRGRLWQWETRVPASRVQHLDLKRGPLERAHRLASLVLHTAGTRLSAVSISGLDDGDAERLRDHFSRQIDRQEDDDHADA